MSFVSYYIPRDHHRLQWVNYGQATTTNPEFMETNFETQLQYSMRFVSSLSIYETKLYIKVKNYVQISISLDWNTG